MKLLLKTIWYAVVSRLKSIIIDVNDLIEIVKSGTKKYYTNGQITVSYFNFDDEDDFNIQYRTLAVLEKLKVTNINLSIIAMPYSFYYMNLQRYLAGVGIYNYQNYNICVVSKYSFLKREIYPYLEHEIAHAVGLLKYDHSNINEFISIIKYK